MAVRFRNYCGLPGITEDYYRVRAFLLKLAYPGFPFGRWDWMITHSYLDESALGKIGIWENEGEIIALATYDTQPGGAFCYAHDEYRYLKAEMLSYSKDHLGRDGEFGIMIPDIDADFQEIAAQAGFIATQGKDCDAVYPIELSKVRYGLPDGFRVTSMAETYDIYKYGQVLWKGFNHEVNGEGKYCCSDLQYRKLEREMMRPNVDLSLKIAVMAPNGDFVSYCGMWYDAASSFALVEPVATDPDYRKLGLGKAAVLEGIRRCGELGAKCAFVGSSQQFYYSIGFRPYATSTWWRQKQPAIATC